MPNTHTSLVSLFDDIADAIRAKTGGSASIVADNFPAEIANIPAGGGGISVDDVANKSFSGTLYSNTLTSVPLGAFQNWTQISAIDLPTCTTISDYSFKGCSSISSISLPSTTNIRISAFQGCTGLVTVNLPSANHFGNNLQSGSVFEGCTNLETVDIGGEFDSTSNIPQYMFLGCSKLKTLIIRSTAQQLPSLGTAPFSGTPIGNLDADAHIYVDPTMVSAYQASSYWGTYSSIISAIPNS